jgi:hypothetical protein
MSRHPDELGFSGAGSGMNAEIRRRGGSGCGVSPVSGRYPWIAGLKDAACGNQRESECLPQPPAEVPAGMAACDPDSHDVRRLEWMPRFPRLDARGR